MLCCRHSAQKNRRIRPHARLSLPAHINDGLHDAGVCQRGYIAKLIVRVDSDFAQDAPHDLAAARLGQACAAALAGQQNLG